jgi:predicted phosphodiesterase
MARDPIRTSHRRPVPGTLFVSAREILFCGDTHGEHRHVLAAAERIRPMAIVLLGDLEMGRAAHLELAPVCDIVWWIQGNHDTDSQETWTNLIDSEVADRCIDGRVVVLPDGTRLAGLGGVFREKIWAPPLPPIHQSYEAWEASLQPRWRKRSTQCARERLKHRSTIFEDAYDRLAAEQADVLVLHEAPRPHPNGWAALNELARAMRVRQVWHGHHHDRPDYRPYWERLGYQVHGVGLRGVTDRAGNVIVKGELDDHPGRRRTLEL